jgi:hypothetical protein
MNAVELAIRAAAKELEAEHEFYFEEEGEDELVQIVTKHIAPLLDVEQYKKLRIAALKGEIDAIESCLNVEVTGLAPGRGSEK